MAAVRKRLVGPLSYADQLVEKRDLMAQFRLLTPEAKAEFEDAESAGDLEEDVAEDVDRALEETLYQQRVGATLWNASTSTTPFAHNWVDLAAAEIRRNRFRM